MLDNPRIFRRSDTDFPTTRALQNRLVAAGRVEGEGPLASNRSAGPRCRLCGCGLEGDPDADQRLQACGSCKKRPEARATASTPANGKPNRKPADQAPAKAPTTTPFSEADRSLIRKVHGYMPHPRLLDVLNDRLRSDLGPDAPPHTAEQLHTEIAASPTTSPATNQGPAQDWAGLRKLIAQARKAGTLDRIDAQIITDFAVVLSLSPKQLMRLKEILLQPTED